MAVSGEQIRREQEDSRRRSRFGYREQVVAPIPPPWNSFWHERQRKIRRAWFLFAFLVPGAVATIWLGESLRPHDRLGPLLSFVYYFAYTLVANHLVLICPRCGHRFHKGRWLGRSCRRCGLDYGQCDNSSPADGRA